MLLGSKCSAQKDNVSCNFGRPDFICLGGFFFDCARTYHKETT